MSATLTVPASLPGNLLSPDEFEKCAAAWLEAVSTANTSALAEAFKTDNAELLQSVYFTVEQIVELVSAVGVAQLRARFVLLNNQSTGVARFNLVLYAADLHDRRLSAYYLGSRPNPEAAQQGSLPRPEAAQLGQGVPLSLATLWLDRWNAAPQVNAAQFVASYGPLKGYNFAVSDFLGALAAVPALGQQQLHAFLGLHSYYAAAPSDAYTEILGLAICFTDGESGTRPAPSAPIYDMAGTVPPQA